MEKLEPIKAFNDHGQGCKGHQNSLLECEFRTQKERDELLGILEAYEFFGVPFKQTVDN